MYKVMIIDDEAMVRWGIRDLLDWEAEGFEVCEDGKDGKEGLKKLLQNRPDLALVDIKMPGMNGIELISEAKKAGFEGHFVILTGYAEFDFARSAIALGVREYLLKPIDEDELGRCVKKIRQELDEKKKEERFHSANEDIARDELLRKILVQVEPAEALEERLNRYHIAFRDECLCAAVVTDRERRQGVVGDDFQEKADFFLQDETLYDEKVSMDGLEVLIIRGTDYTAWENRLAARNERLRRKCGSGLLIAVGHNVNQWCDLHFSYEFAQFLLEQEFLFGQYDVLSINAIEAQKNAAENPSPDQLLMLIEVGDLEGIRESVEKFGAYCTGKLMKELDIRIQIMYQLMLIRNGLEKKYGAFSGRTQEMMEEMNRAEKMDRLMELYCCILQDMCRQIGADQPGTVIKRMYYYMEKSYGQDLKLENFARMFNYNSNYLGKIFRREIGDTFNNILDTIRITNAKRLLEETDLKVYQISEQVGYNNIDYFYLKFKKYVGISPKEYKKEALRK